MLRILSRWLDAPPLPRRITARAWELLWWDGVSRGATAASLGWIALILFALLVATLIRRASR